MKKTFWILGLIIIVTFVILTVFGLNSSWKNWDVEKKLGEEARKKAEQNQIIKESQEVLPKDVVPPHADVRIDSVTPNGVTWGQTIIIKGVGFAEGGRTIVRLKGDDNTYYFLWYGTPVSDNELKITIPQSMDVCVRFESSSTTCKEYKKLLWGMYKMNIDNANGTSNVVDFAIYRS